MGIPGTPVHEIKRHIEINQTLNLFRSQELTSHCINYPHTLVYQDTHQTVD